MSSNLQIICNRVSRISIYIKYQHENKKIQSNLIGVIKLLKKQGWKISLNMHLKKHHLIHFCFISIKYFLSNKNISISIQPLDFDTFIFVQCSLQWKMPQFKCMSHFPICCEWSVLMKRQQSPLNTHDCTGLPNDCKWPHKTQTMK